MAAVSSKTPTPDHALCVDVDVKRIPKHNLVSELIRKVHETTKPSTTHVALVLSNVPVEWTCIGTTMDVALSLELSHARPALSCRAFLLREDASDWLGAPQPYTPTACVRELAMGRPIYPRAPMRTLVLTAAWPLDWNTSTRQTFLRLVHQLSEPTKIRLQSEVASSSIGSGLPIVVVQHRDEKGRYRRTMLGSEIVRRIPDPNGRRVLVITMDQRPSAKPAVDASTRVWMLTWPVPTRSGLSTASVSLDKVLCTHTSANTDTLLRSCAEWFGVQ